MDWKHFLSAVEMTSLSSCQSNPLPFPCCGIASGEHLPVSKTLFLIAQLPVASLSVKQGPVLIPGIDLNRNMHTPRRQKSFSLWWHTLEPRSYLCSWLALCGLSPGGTLKPLRTAVASWHELPNGSKQTKTQAKWGKLRLLASNSKEDDGYCLQSKAGNVCLRAKPLISELCHTTDSPFFTPYSSANPYRSLSTNPSFQSPIPLPAQLPPCLVGELWEHSDPLSTWKSVIWGTSMHSSFLVCQTTCLWISQSETERPCKWPLQDAEGKAETSWNSLPLNQVKRGRVSHLVTHSSRHPLRGDFPAALVTPLEGSRLTCWAKMSNTKTSGHTWWQRPSSDPSDTVCEESQHHVQKSMLGSLPWSSCSDLFNHKASEWRVGESPVPSLLNI